MKKILLMTAIVLGFALAACGGNGSEPTTGNGSADGNGSELATNNDGAGSNGNEPAASNDGADGNNVPNATSSAELGNTFGNLANHGAVAYANGRVFYSNRQDGGIYSANIDGSDHQRLSDGRAEYINVIGDRLFFVGDAGIYTMKTDGSDRESMLGFNQNFARLIVVGNRIYYQNFAVGSRGLHVMNIDGTDSQLIGMTGGSFPMVVENQIFFKYHDLDAGLDNIHVMNTDGSNQRALIAEEDLPHLAIGVYFYADGRIFFPE